jgi:hypothetical protein
MLRRSAKEKEIGRLAGSASSTVSDGEFKRHTDALESQARPPPPCAAARALHIRMRCTLVQRRSALHCPPCHRPAYSGKRRKTSCAKRTIFGECTPGDSGCSICHVCTDQRRAATAWLLPTYIRVAHGHCSAKLEAAADELRAERKLKQEWIDKANAAKARCPIRPCICCTSCSIQ